MSQETTKQAHENRLNSPEQLNDYLHVTNPKIWMLLVAVILLIASLLTWASLTTIESYVTGTAYASNGELTVKFEDPNKAANVQAGMNLEVGNVETSILTVGRDSNGAVVASAQAKIPDGVYDARVGYNTQRVISLLLN